MNRSMRVMAIALTGLVAAVSVAPSVTAAQALQWTPAPVSTQQAVVRVMNARAADSGAAEHSPGCFTVLLLTGHKNIAAVSLRPKANVKACGTPTSVGIQAFKKSGKTWMYVGGTTGPARTHCTYSKAATGAIKALLKSSGLCG
jgi:hypothetical protein